MNDTASTLPNTPYAFTRTRRQGYTRQLRCLPGNYQPVEVAYVPQSASLAHCRAVLGFLRGRVERAT